MTARGRWALSGAPTRPQERSGRFRDDQTGVPVPQNGGFSRAPALFLEAAQRVSSSLLELLRHLRINSASPKVGLRRYFQRSSADPLCSSPRVHEPTGPRGHGTTTPRDHGATSPRVHGTTGARGHGPTGPRAHGTTGPRAHGPMRCLGKTTQPLRSC